MSKWRYSLDAVIIAYVKHQNEWIRNENGKGIYFYWSSRFQNRLCAIPKPAAPKPVLRLCWTCRTKTGFAPTLNLLFILNKYFDCLRGNVLLSGFGFSSPYLGFKLSIWHYAGFVLTRFETNPVL